MKCCHRFAQAYETRVRVRHSHRRPFIAALKARREGLFVSFVVEALLVTPVQTRVSSPVPPTLVSGPPRIRLHASTSAR